MDEKQMSSEESTKYWEAVLETIKLIRGLKQYQEEHPEIPRPLTDYLDEIIQKAAAKSGGATSLTQELGLSFLARKPSSYWKGVEDTVRTVHDFLQWKEENLSDSRTLDTFLVEFWAKTEQKVRKESALAQELGMDFLVQSSSTPSESPAFMMPPTVPHPPLESPPPSIQESSPSPVTTPSVTPEPLDTPRVEAGPAVPSTIITEPVPPREEGPGTLPEPVHEPLIVPKPEPILDEEPIRIQISDEPEIQLSEDLLSQLREEEPPVPSLDDSSLTDELLDTSEEENDLLSSSLRAALKMLRDENEE